MESQNFPLTQWKSRKLLQTKGEFRFYFYVKGKEIPYLKKKFIRLWKLQNGKPLNG